MYMYEPKKMIHNLINVDLEQINLSIITAILELRLVLLAPRTNIMLHSIAYTAGKIWNALLMNVMCASSLNIFKLHLACICSDDL